MTSQLAMILNWVNLYHMKMTNTSVMVYKVASRVHYDITKIVLCTCHDITMHNVGAKRASFIILYYMLNCDIAVAFIVNSLSFYKTSVDKTFKPISHCY